MDPPYVYIEKEPLLDMVLASIETFRRECLGLLFGRTPSRTRNYFHITNTVNIQMVRKRKNKEIEQNKTSAEKIREVCSQYPNLYPLIGDFHSHPEWGRCRREATMSDADLEDMRKRREELKVCLVIKVSLINKERVVWEPVGGGGIRGSLAKYKFHINAIRLIGDDKEEILEIRAPSAIKALNKAIGYQ